MKYFCYLLVIIFSSSLLNAQVGIGTTTPRAALEVSSVDNGGVLIPSYALTGRDDAMTVVNPVTPDPLVVGTLVYNTANTTGANSITEGFVFWDGVKWQRIVPSTGIMLRTYQETDGNNDNFIGIGGIGFQFNFADESFNNIRGAFFANNKIILPTGVYKIRSNMRVSGSGGFPFTIDWFPKLGGNEIAGSIRGSSAPPELNSNTAETEMIAVFEITDASAELDFEIGFIAGNNQNQPPGGGPIVASQSYVIIEKLQ